MKLNRKAKRFISESFSEVEKQIEKDKKEAFLFDQDFELKRKRVRESLKSSRRDADTKR